MNVDVCIDAIYYAMVISASGIARFDRFGQMLRKYHRTYDIPFMENLNIHKIYGHKHLFHGKESCFRLRTKNNIIIAWYFGNYYIRPTDFEYISELDGISKRVINHTHLFSSLKNQSYPSDFLQQITMFTLLQTGCKPTQNLIDSNKHFCRLLERSHMLL